MHNQATAPAKHLKTNRNYLKALLLGLLTLCIYPVFSRDINTIAGEYDGKKTRSLFVLGLLMTPFILIGAFVVWYVPLFAWLGFAPLQLSFLPANLSWTWSLLGLLPLCIGIIIWNTRLSCRIHNELHRRQLPYRFGAGTYWLWGFFGVLLLIGPLVYLQKLCRAMNVLSADYNING